MKRELEAGLAAVQRLDAIVVNRLGDDRAVAAVWSSARHVERASPKPSARTPVPGPGPVPRSTATGRAAAGA